ncbi:Protein of unknown function [Cotesia congregata]|uniref:Uncharacterized protein n=1 Tax=Cotesia congregata TaxID=51543 RepID=A0A8J2H670_COTCN|nr:Protein of unknown function [Cotesia congregata]
MQICKHAMHSTMNTQLRKKIRGILTSGHRHLLEMCFLDELKPVAVTVDLINVVYEIPRDETAKLSIIVIDDHFSSKVIKEYYPRHPSFVLSGDSLEALIKNLHEIKTAKIWNVKSLFVIVGTQCHNSAAVLKLLWEIEALSSFYICQDEFNNKTLIFTFNPFSNYAPKPWERVAGFDRSDSRWTLIRQRFINDANICESIKFDKSARLDGFPLKGVKDGIRSNASFGKNHEILSPLTNDFFQTSLSMINSTPVVYTICNVSYGNPFKNRKYDFLWKPYVIKFTAQKYVDIMAFYDQDGYVILTRKQKTVPVISQIVDCYFNVWTVNISVFILTTILIVIYINHNYHLREALMDMLSLMLDMEMIVPMSRMSMRLIFFAASLFMLIFNPALQGHLSAVLTKPARQQVDTLEQLYTNHFHVHFDFKIENELLMTGLWSYTSDKKYLHRNFIMKYSECLVKLLKNDSAACIMNSNYLPYEKLHDEVHLSQYLYFNEYSNYVSRQNWPLKDKFDKTAMNFVENGYADYHKKKSLFKRLLRKKQLIARIDAAEQNDELDFGYFELDYLIIPLCSIWTILVLIFEVMIKKFKIWNKKRQQKSKTLKLRARRRIAGIVRRMAGCCRSSRIARIV